MFEIIILISEHLHLAGLELGVAKHLLAFDNLCGATARVTECLAAYYRCFRMSTRLVLLSLWSLNGGCQTCTSLQQSLQRSNGGLIAFDSLCGAQTGVSLR